MNIKISKEQHDRLCKINYKEFIFGSRLFGTETKESDYDYIRIYNPDDIFSFKSYLPNINSFQFDSVDTNEQFIWMTVRQFYQNLYSGDGTMQSDIFLFSGKFKNVLETCRTLKVIKAYLGVARRDLKLHKTKHKLFHANRSFYIASCLIDNVMPKKEVIKNMKNNLLSKEDLLPLLQANREKANEMYQNHELHNYYIPDVGDDLLQIMINSNNTREFRY